MLLIFSGPPPFPLPGWLRVCESASLLFLHAPLRILWHTNLCFTRSFSVCFILFFLFVCMPSPPFRLQLVQWTYVSWCIRSADSPFIFSCLRSYIRIVYFSCLRWYASYVGASVMMRALFLVLFPEVVLPLPVTGVCPMTTGLIFGDELMWEQQLTVVVIVVTAPVSYTHLTLPTTPYV